MQGGQYDPAAFYKKVLEGNAFTEEAKELPPYALEMLVENPAMGRVVGASLELESQRVDVVDLASIIEEIQVVMAGAQDSIGTFSSGREALSRIRDDAMVSRQRLLAVELAKRIEEEDGAKARDLRDQLELLAARGEEIHSQEGDATDRYQAYEDQVREVQGMSSQVLELAMEQKADFEAARRVLRDKLNTMSGDEAAEVEAQLAAVDVELGAIVRELEAIGSEATRMSVMSSVPRGRTDATDIQRSFVASEYDALRGQVVALRRGMSPFEATVDDLWARTRALDLAAVRTRVKLDNAERSELSLVKKKLAEEIRIAASLAAEIESTDGGASGLATRITQAGFSLAVERPGRLLVLGDLLPAVPWAAEEAAPAV
jgi:hypothetical protein